MEESKSNNQVHSVEDTNQDAQDKIYKEIDKLFDNLIGDSHESITDEQDDELDLNFDDSGSFQTGQEDEDECSHSLKNFPAYVRDFLESDVCRDDQREWIYSMPWVVDDLPDIDMEQAAKILQESHYGLEGVKVRIMEYISLQKHLGKSYGAILLLTGPPGVGKTSIAKSIAKAMKREFVKIPLDGVSAALEIKGSEKSWKSAQPGLIARALRRCGTLCPVMLLDELDKMGKSREWGLPDAALLEALDSEREHFIDSFMEVPIDLSNVVFIATANDISEISPVLLDRMDIIELRGYTLEEKMHIAMNYIVPFEMKAHRLTESMLEITDSALRAMVELYSREPGVRHLQSLIKTVCRKAVYNYVTGKIGRLIVDKNTITAILGHAPVVEISVGNKPEVGVVNGIAITVSGEGIIRPIEASMIPGDGDVCYTGGMIEEAVESCEVAMSIICIRSSKWGLSSNVFDTKDIHIHTAPIGVKKNGSSIGLALYTALISALLSNPVKHDIAMTGEITLRGKVMPVGAIDEKVSAAYRAGLKAIIIPEGNRYHLDDISQEIMDSIEIITVSDVDEAIEYALIRPDDKEAVV